MFDALTQIIKKRHSVRNYDPRPVPREIIDTMLDAARYAPSACNAQPWRFIVVDNPTTREKLVEKGLGIVVPNHFAKSAPVIIVACADTSFMVHSVASAISRIDYHLLDIGAAIENMLLTATSLGLGTCWMGWFREKNIKMLLKIPKRIQIVSLIAVGYAASDEKIPEKKRLEKTKIISYNSFGVYDDVVEEGKS